MTDQLTVRDARPEDLPVLHAMIQELAEYEGMPEGPQLRVQDLLEDGFESEPPWFFALVAEAGGQVVGWALVNRAYSSWTGRALYLEDLFVRGAARRRGAGLALVRAVCQRALQLRAARLDWHVLASNRPALAFYARLGALDLCRAEGRAAMRLPAPRIAAVAAGHLLPRPPSPDATHPQ